MRYRDMARQYLLEAQIRAARSVDERDGESLDAGRRFTPAELRHFRRAVNLELALRVREAEEQGAIEGGTVLPQELAA